MTKLKKPTFVGRLVGTIAISLVLAALCSTAGCSLWNGEKHTGPVTVSAFTGVDQYQFERANREMFVMSFVSRGAPSFSMGQRLDDVVYTDDGKNVRNFVKAVMSIEPMLHTTVPTQTSSDSDCGICVEPGRMVIGAGVEIRGPVTIFTN